MEINIIHNQECLEGMRLLPDGSVDCIVTSPPYFGLRDYGNDKQLGNEATPSEFVNNLVQILREGKRVLKKEGTLWLNLGDSYAGSGGLDADGSWNPGDGTSKQGTHRNNQNQIRKINPNSLNKSNIEEGAIGNKWVKPPQGYKQKDLIGIPWMVAFALRADGWYLRQDIIWNKPNPMPESVTDRCTKSHEYIFLLSKSKKYYYDQEAIKKPFVDPMRTNYTSGSRSNGINPDRNDNDFVNRSKAKAYKHRGEGDKKLTGHSGNYDANGILIGNGMANKRSVWTVNTMPYKEAHFATFPEELIVDCIKAGCPEGGIILDPFMGAGTTALVARKLNRNFIGFELNPNYIKITLKRIHDQLGFFA